MPRAKIEWEEKEWKQFEELCKIQCTQIEICCVMGITDKTLTRLIKEKYGEGFSDIYKKYSDHGKSSLRRYQFDMAKTNATMAIWLGKQYLDQKDKQEVKTDATITYTFDGDMGDFSK